MGFWDTIKDIFTKDDTPQLGAPIIKSTEVTSTTDTSSVQVVDVSQPTFSPVPTGSVSTVYSGSGGGGTSDPTTTTITSTTIPTTTIVEQEPEKEPIIVEEVSSGTSTLTPEQSQRLFLPGQAPISSRFSTFESGDTPLEFGVPFIKKSERDKVSPTSLVFELESTTLEEAKGEGKRIAQLGGVQVVAQPFDIRPDLESFEFGQASIARTKIAEREIFSIQTSFQKEPESFIGKPGVEVKEVEGGKDIILTEKFFAESFTGIDRKAAIIARQRTADLPREDRRTLSRRSLGTGAAQLGVTFVEFGASVGTMKLDGGDLKPFTLQRIKQRDVAALQGLPGRQRTVTFMEDPSKFLGETVGPRALTQTALIGGSVGLSLISGTEKIATGVGTGVARKVSRTEKFVGAFSGLSPIRIKPGVFGTKAIKIPKVVVIKETGKGITSRTIIGTDTSGTSKIFSIQATRQTPTGITVGPVRTVVEVPSTIISKGGKVISGTLVTGTEGFLAGGGAGRVFIGSRGIVTRLPPVAQGSIGNVLIRTKYASFVPTEGRIFGQLGPSRIATLERGAGFSVPKTRIGEGVSQFTFGDRTRVYTAFGEGGKRIFTPQRYRLKPEGFGVEIDLNKLLGKGGSKIKVLKGGGKKTPFSVTFQDQQLLSPQLATIKPTIKGLQKVKVKSKPDTTVAIVGGGPRDFVKLKVLDSPQITTVSKSRFDVASDISDISTSRFKLESGTGLKKRTKIKTDTILLPRIKTRLDEAVIQKPRVVQTFKTGVKQDFEFIPGFIGDPVRRIKQPGLRTTGRGGFGFFIPDLPSFDMGGKGGRVTKDRTFFRQPSFGGALLPTTLGVEVPKLSVKLEETGLVERPLIKKKRKKKK